MDYRKEYRRWLESDQVDNATKDELRAIENDEDEIKYRFYSYLTFGTAGLRGTMNAGANAMNLYTVAHATQGLANMILETGTDAAKRGAVIAYDCRNNSEAFAKRTASVLAANGIHVYLFDALRPTPLLSYSIGKLHCIAGINITASHNPKEYNGYKAYWEDGAQISPAVADRVSAQIAKTDIFHDVKIIDFENAVADGKIELVGAALDEAYLTEVQKQIIHPAIIRQAGDQIHIVYTPLHGTGHKLVPEILKRAGFSHISCVPEQMIIDGNFPTVSFPNPEFREVFALGTEIAKQNGAELVIATDPDADRVGVIAKCADGAFNTITGNQMGCLLLDYIITQLKAQGKLPDGAYAVKSIVSTEMATKICSCHGVTMFNVFTGFKNIGEKIDEMERAGNNGFLLGFEESYGYLRGDYAKDKDAVVSAMLICEMAAYYSLQGMTLYDALNALYDKYGHFVNDVESVYMEGLDGLEKMKAVMQQLRENPPKEIGGIAVSRFTDYQAQTALDCQTEKKAPTGLAKTNMLSFLTVAGDTVVIRPSGTEPKIKLYFLVGGSDEADAAGKSKRYRESTKSWVQ